MREIDFLPDWYKNGRKRRTSYRRQYIAVGCIFAVLAAWSFAEEFTVSKTKAELNNMQIYSKQENKIIDE